MRHHSRRQFLTQLGRAGAGAALLGACGNGRRLDCATDAQLTAGQQAARDGRGYVERSDDPAATCANCAFFTGGPDACGRCQIDALPANPAGYCVSWTAVSTGWVPSRRGSGDEKHG